MTNLTHRWSEPIRFAHKSERECRHCGIVKVTRHEDGRHWVEYWRNGEEKIAGEGGATPACERARP